MPYTGMQARRMVRKLAMPLWMALQDEHDRNIDEYFNGTAPYAGNIDEKMAEITAPVYVYVTKVTGVPFSDIKGAEWDASYRQATGLYGEHP